MKIPTAFPTLIPSKIPTAFPTVALTNYPSLSPNSVFIISTIAGTGSSSFSGDNGAATSAGINPYGVVLDTSGKLRHSISLAYQILTPSL